MLLHIRQQIASWNFKHVPEVPAQQVLDDWLARHADFQVAAAGEETDAPVEDAKNEASKKGYRAISLSKAQNLNTKEGRAARYDFVKQIREKMAERRGTPLSIDLDGQFVVIQHPDSLHLFALDIAKPFETTSGLSGSLWTTVMAGVWWQAAGVAVAIYHGVTYGYRYLWQNQADPAALMDILKVASSGGSLGRDEVVGVRLQSPEGQDLSLVLLMAPPIETLTPPHPEGSWRARLGAVGRLISGRPASRDNRVDRFSQLRPTLIGFSLREKKDEIPATTPVP